MKRNIQKRRNNENDNNSSSNINTTATGDSDGGTINYDNLLDDDEQEKILQQLIIKTNEYQQLAYSWICILCYIISVLCFFGSIYIDYKYYNNKNCKYNTLIIQRWFHTIVSILLHIIIPFIIKNVTESLSMIQTMIPIHLLILCNILISMYILLLQENKPYEYELYDNDEYFYYYYQCYYHSIKLFVSNILVVLLSIYLRYDILSSYNNISDLQSFKYHYKSI